MYCSCTSRTCTSTWPIIQCTDYSIICAVSSVFVHLPVAFRRLVSGVIWKPGFSQHGTCKQTVHVQCTGWRRAKTVLKFSNTFLTFSSRFRHSCPVYMCSGSCCWRSSVSLYWWSPCYNTNPKVLSKVGIYRWYRVHRSLLLYFRLSLQYMYTRSCDRVAVVACKLWQKFWTGKRERARALYRKEE